MVRYRTKNVGKVTDHWPVGFSAVKKPEVKSDVDAPFNDISLIR